MFKEFECLLHRTWYINGELIQYTVSGSSLNAFHRYVISNGVPSDHWATQFQWAATADHMYRLALEQNDVNCQAIALTMRAFCMAHCTDGFGDVPFTEAFQGRDGLAQPLFDTQRSIYERLYEDLELANSLYDVSKSLKIAFARPALRRRHGQMETVHHSAAPAAADALHQPRRGVGHIGTYPFARFAADALSAVREQ